MNEQRAKAKSSGFENNVTSSHTSEGRSEDLFKFIMPKWDHIHAVLDTSCYKMSLI